MQEIMGVLIGSAVCPIAMCLVWSKTNKWGAITGAVLGQWLGLASWLIFAKVQALLIFFPILKPADLLYGQQQA